MANLTKPNIFTLGALVLAGLTIFIFSNLLINYFLPYLQLEKESRAIQIHLQQYKDIELPAETTTPDLSSLLKPYINIGSLQADTDTQTISGQMSYSALYTLLKEVELPAKLTSLSTNGQITTLIFSEIRS